ncbi:MAG: hypothetical protein ACYDAG_02140 [Chloroflexota bacterium]
MAKHQYTIVGTGQEEDPRIAESIDEAEREIDEARVNVRFGREQLDTVRRAAALRGVPYQIYIKDAVYERAFQDLSARVEYEVRKRELLSSPANEETRRLHEMLGASDPPRK